MSRNKDVSRVGDLAVTGTTSPLASSRLSLKPAGTKLLDSISRKEKHCRTYAAAVSPTTRLTPPLPLPLCPCLLPSSTSTISMPPTRALSPPLSSAFMTATLDWVGEGGAEPPVSMGDPGGHDEDEDEEEDEEEEEGEGEGEEEAQEQVLEEEEGATKRAFSCDKEKAALVPGEASHH